MSTPQPSRRGNPSMGDIVRTTVLLGGIVMVLWLVGLVMTDTPDDPVRAVEYSQTADSARDAATYPLLAPRSLPEDWRANGVRYSPGRTQDWHLGVLTADDRYIGLEQAVRPAQDMVEEFAAGSTEDGTVDIGGTTWQVRTGPDDAYTLVSEADGVTTLITSSTAPRDEVDRYVASLRAD